MRPLRFACLVLVAVFLVGCCQDVGRYESFGPGPCRLDTATGEVVCSNPESEATRRVTILIPAGPHSPKWAERFLLEKGVTAGP